MVKMKDSGIEWIGEILETWKVVRGKNILKLLSRKVEPDYEIITAFRDGQVTLRKNRRTEGFTISTKEIGYQGVKANDLVVHAMDGFAGAIGISDADGKASPVLNILDSNQNKRYVMYYLRVCALLGVFQALAKGIRIRTADTRWDTLKNLNYLLPPKSEQQQIADFLDHKTAEIGGLIDKIHTEIDTLKQYQSSVITQAVTKGLDPNVQMKDSGSEWIGEIPETWKTIKVKYLVDKLERGTAPKYTELHETQVVNQATFSKGFFDKSNMRYSTIPASQSRGLLQYQDVLVASTGGGVLGKVHYFTEHEEFVADSHVTIVRFIAQKLIPKFGYYYLSTLYDVFNNVMAQGSTNQIELKRDTFANSFIPFPRIEEQRVIVDYLDQKVTQIQKLINSKQQQINQLTEYKNSLIFEYVTGKKQVKEAN
ncbi:restriction endonuclease subunit S [Ligilactobacillus salivarius]|uniref:Type I restriction modification DNA specificity domain-containing protein n=1 Tax=Ligilactobacillus salivarius TaxID=1624 RepID=A0A9X6S4A6_9LACO|nr:restriction endonuclease subunit S [Ligilactobacillus salivarius]PAY26930.1 hypothetical protein A8C33_07535 [Ligilactobacillus salivarius]PAY29186.1 hypothetical protein A8C49_07015 [Ligilactobacillus salivarius]PAY30410.1 hypothetical protein A8C44_08235 [Ligilactobacillus salivarius]PAY35503.1 hypothetical protein A8C50_07190 [Ligilactobacillus salivarius]PAY40541.1 hypothetical protein A8C51_07555 [Ligilactobacillus salivarius]